MQPTDHLSEPHISVSEDRLIGRWGDMAAGPLVVVTAGIHGNEPSGVEALEALFESLGKTQVEFNGCLIGLRGNCRALQMGKRFHTEDLNRIWTRERLRRWTEGHPPIHPDEAEMYALLSLIEDYRKRAKEPIYFFDLHTTSSQTIPFTTVNDSLLNRSFAEQLPVPMILGIEEYLDGPLLSYLNDLGYVSFGFEGGQHDDALARKAHYAFLQLSLYLTGLRTRDRKAEAKWRKAMADLTHGVQGIFEIVDRHAIASGETFCMRPGYANFQRVEKGEILADSNEKPLRAKKSQRIFMPLYQKQGRDGFFIISPTARFFLWLSKQLRLRRLDRLLVLLPGVSWNDEARSSMKVDRRTARFLARQLLHLFGYRSRVSSDRYFIAYNREAHSRNEDYEGAPWLSSN